MAAAPNQDSDDVMYGFDTASSLGEETLDPRRTAPTAIRAVVASFVVGGLILLFCILAAPDPTDPALGQKNGVQVRGRYHVGTLPEHMAKNMEGAPDGQA